MSSRCLCQRPDFAPARRAAGADPRRLRRRAGRRQGADDENPALRVDRDRRRRARWRRQFRISRSFCQPKEDELKRKISNTAANRAAAAAIRNHALLALIDETGLRMAEIAKLSAGAAVFATPTTTGAANLVFKRLASRWRLWPAVGAEAAPPAPDGLGEPPLRRPKRSRRTTKRGKTAKSVHSRKSQKNSKTPRGRR